MEFRADLVLELRDAKGTLVPAIVIEVQRDVDPDKALSWAAYVEPLVLGPAVVPEITDPADAEIETELAI